MTGRPASCCPSSMITASIYALDNTEFQPTLPWLLHISVILLQKLFVDYRSICTMHCLAWTNWLFVTNTHNINNRDNH